jgi:hypothetical protein
MSWDASRVYGPISDGGGFYLLNIAPELMRPALAPYRVHPATPDVVWAGDVDFTGTIFLKFADETTARSLLPALWRGA